MAPSHRLNRVNIPLDERLRLIRLNSPMNVNKWVLSTGGLPSCVLRRARIIPGMFRDLAKVCAVHD